MAQYGLDNFIFEVLEDTTDLRNREQHWIEQLKPSYNNNWAKGWNTKQYKEAHKETHRQQHVSCKRGKERMWRAYGKRW